jgi:hypothetical protein
LVAFAEFVTATLRHHWLAGVVILLLVALGLLALVRGGDDPRAVSAANDPNMVVTSTSATGSTTGPSPCERLEYRGTITGTVEGFSGGVTRFSEAVFTLGGDCSLHAELRWLMEFTGEGWTSCVAFVGSGNGSAFAPAHDLRLDVGGSVAVTGETCPLVDGRPGDLGPWLSPLDHPWPIMVGLIDDQKVRGSVPIQHAYATMQLSVTATRP